VAVGALEPRFYAALLKGLEIDPAEAPQQDIALWPGLHARFAAVFATRDRDDWIDRFAGTEACVTPVLTFEEAASHPHNRARQTHVQAGIVQPAPAPRFDSQVTPVSSERPTLTLDQVLERWR
jgi:alpha-methylacyl-CoA racemase